MTTDGPRSRTRHRAEYSAAVVLDLAAAAVVLLVAGRTWQVVRTPRPPLPPDVLPLTGRTVDGAPTALALVALAGVVAIIATRGLARRIVGVVLVLTGAATAWRGAAASSAVSAARARLLVRRSHPAVPTDRHVLPAVSAHSGWPWLTLGCGVLLVVAGALVAARGHLWAGLSARYENRAARETSDAATPEPAPEGTDDPAADPETVAAERARAATTMWNALDRGDDPTAPG